MGFLLAVEGNLAFAVRDFVAGPHLDARLGGGAFLFRRQERGESENELVHRGSCALQFAEDLGHLADGLAAWLAPFAIHHDHGRAFRTHDHAGVRIHARPSFLHLLHSARD